MTHMVEACAVEGVVVVTPEVFADARGLFVETWRKEWVSGAAFEPVQANRADRSAGTLVGMHYHLHQADYWYVPFGRAFVALADLRSSSPTRGVVVSFEIGAHDHRGVYIPPGVAHGFYAMTDVTITYLVDRCYDPSDELGVAWDDPELAVAWPVPVGVRPVLSARDEGNPRWADLPEDRRPL